MRNLILIIGFLLPLASACAQEPLSAKDAGTQAFADKDYEKAYKLWLPLAISGDSEVEFAIAMLLSNGYGFDKPNPTERDRENAALPWIRKAASSHNKDALNWLADSYKNGWFRLPVDKQLSDCWRGAIQQPDTVGSCIALEKSRGILSAYPR